jgi:hypothetical protein
MEYWPCKWVLNPKCNNSFRRHNTTKRIRWGRWIFKGYKFRSTTSFGGEVKPAVPCRKIYGMLKSVCLLLFAVDIHSNKGIIIVISILLLLLLLFFLGTSSLEPMVERHYSDFKFQTVALAHSLCCVILVIIAIVIFTGLVSERVLRTRPLLIFPTVAVCSTCYIA